MAFKIKTMNCPVCGEPAWGTCETIPGCALITEPDEDGKVEWAGETDVFWDGQTTDRDPDDRSRWEIQCQAGHTWYSDVEDA